MPYEALARALENISGDYAKAADDDRKRVRATAEEQRLYDRGRADKTADTKDARAYDDKVRGDNEASAIRMAKEQANIAFAAKMKEIQELDPLKFRQALENAAAQFGIDGVKDKSNSELYSSVNKKKNEENATAIISNAVAVAKAKTQTEDTERNDKNFAANAEKDQANLLIKKGPEIRATLADYDTATAALNALKDNDSKLAGTPLTLADYAQQKVAIFLKDLDSLPPKDRNARLLAAAPLMANAKTPEQARSAILANPGQWAKDTGAITEKDVANFERVTAAALKQNGYADRPDIAGLIQRINRHAVTLTGYGIVPGVPFEKQFPGTVAAPASASGALAPAVSAPSTVSTSPGSVGTDDVVPPVAPVVPVVPAAPAGSSVGAPTPSPVAPPEPVVAPTAPAPAWWSPQRDGAANQEAFKTGIANAARSTGQFFAGMPSAVAAGNDSFNRSVGNFLTPSNWTTSGDGRALIFDPGHTQVSPQGAPAYPPQGSAKEAEDWIQQSGISLDPKVKSLLAHEYQIITASESLSPQEKAFRIESLKDAAHSQNLRSAPSVSASSYFAPPSAPAKVSAPDFVQQTGQAFDASGVSVDPKVKGLLMAQYQMILSSDLPPEEKSARLAELKSRAATQSTRPPSSAAGYWGR
jgi:hypothetical protein